MIAACRKCTSLYSPPDQPIHADLVGLCARCRSFAKLVDVVDDLLHWTRTVEVVSGTDAAKRLGVITERAARVVEEARAT